MTVEKRYCVVLTTCGDKDEAEGLARLLVEKRLAACVQISGVTSVYEWEKEIQRDDELLLVIKARADLYGEIEGAISDNHSYEVPEIIKIPIEEGLDAYLGWIDEVSRK
jgi:periplasmic divalent cation tolerance protein